MFGGVSFWPAVPRVIEGPCPARATPSVPWVSGPMSGCSKGDGLLSTVLAVLVVPSVTSCRGEQCGVILGSVASLWDIVSLVLVTSLVSGEETVVPDVTNFGERLVTTVSLVTVIFFLVAGFE